MRWRKCNFRALPLLGGALLALGLAGQSAQADTSAQVGYMGTLSIQNGGALPSSGTAYVGFTFRQATRATLSLANLLGNGASPICGAGIKCDTFVLNVASSFSLGGLGCNVGGNLTAQQKADLVAFVQQGGKLIIYDSECVPQDYSWLPYPFATSNPGAQGARGTLTIVEDNVLSSANSGDSHYINAVLVATGTDAVGDMNVMVTRDPNWCLDLSGTNVQPVTGPVHTYARFGSGLMLYNGMDVDFMTTSTQPGTTTGATNLAKIWLQELQAPFNPSPQADLPCGATVIGLNLTPASALNTLPAQNSHTVTATLKDLLNNPEPGPLMTFSILSGPNFGATGTCAPVSCITDANGQVSFTYASNMTQGQDLIQVCTLDNTGQQLCSQAVTKDWIFGAAAVCDVDADGDIDKLDLALISRARGQLAAPADARDSDFDGLITPNDVKVCIKQCTRPSCAIQ